MNILLRRLSFTLFIAISSVGLLHAQPTAPTTEQVAELKAMLADERPIAADASTLTGFEIDPASREESRTFYRTVFNASQDIDLFDHWLDPDDPAPLMDPDHAFATGDAGDTSQDYKNHVQRRVNYIRAMAGVPAVIVFNNTFSAKSQQAALMMSANDQLSHYPDEGSWAFWTADGYEAAGKSNLAIGSSGPESIMGYMQDHGSSNYKAGHRRWILYPQTEIMGTGDVPGHPAYQNRRAANSLWVQDDNYFGPRPDVRDTFVAWPPPGYVPFDQVFPRWSVSYPGANFAGAVVTMKRDGSSISVVKEPPAENIGEPTLVWVYDGLDATVSQNHPRPGADTTYSVVVDNVIIGGSAQKWEYDVIVFDPDQAGNDFEPTTISGSATPSVGANNSYTVTMADFATGIQWRRLSLSANTSTEGAESGVGHLQVNTQDYSVIQSDVRNSGQNAFRFTRLQGNGQTVESLEIPVDLLIDDGAELVFHSRLGYATTIQQARAEISSDGGGSWTVLYSQNGVSVVPNYVPGETRFIERRVSLSSFTGSTARFRFSYVIDGSDSWLIGENPGTGWYIDDIEVTNSSVISVESTSLTKDVDSPGIASFTYNPSSAGDYALQARPVFYGDYPLDWGPVATVTAEEGSSDPLIGGTPVDGLPGWFFSDWFGFYNPGLAPWVFHAEHGFLYRFPGSTDAGTYFYDNAMAAWWWTSKSSYPSLYAFDPPVDNGGTDIGSEWLWYFVGTGGPRAFSVLTGPSFGSFLSYNP